MTNNSKNIKLTMSQEYVLVTALSTFVVICSVLTVNCEISVKRTNAAYKSPEGYAFYALRSCHRTLRGESGEFFSPDYLCSNPPLWCNWTIQVQPGRQIRLRLEDYTPADACHLKQDQIHLDELPGSGRHRTLEQCWQDVVYTSDSSTLYVVLLIGGSLPPTYRGFHARYHAFSPPPPHTSPPTTKGHHGHQGREAEENLQGDGHERLTMERRAMDDDPASKSTTRPPSLKEGSGPESPLPQQPLKTTPAGRAGTKGFPARSTASDLHAGEAGDLGLTEGVTATPEPDSEEMWNDIARPSAPSESPAKGDPSKGAFANSSRKEGLGQDRPVTATSPSPVQADLEPSTQDPTAHPVQKQPGAPLARGTRAPLEVPSSAPPPPPSPLQGGAPDDEDDDDASEEGSRSMRKLRDGEDEAASPEQPPLHGNDPPSGPPLVERQERENGRGGGSAEPSDPLLAVRHPNVLEATLDNSWRERIDPARYLRNASRLAPLPGEHMFEVSVEVHVNPDANENWDHMVRSLMSTVQTMIQDELKSHAAPKSMSSIRIKRLSAGVLYIFWLQFDEGLDSLQVHRFMQMGLQRLHSQAVNTRGRRNPASIAFVSSEDVNECGTQLVLCDVNAECVNRFGTYACRCNPGFEDKSRLGTGGTICVGLSVPGRSSPSSPAQMNFLYGLCFLLGFFVILLLCVVGALYRRHHRGAFLVRCHSRDDDSNNNDMATAAASATAGHNGSQLPPPPPPIRRPRDGWGNPKDRCPSTDLPLLKFSPLAPPEDPVCKEREEGDKL